MLLRRHLQAIAALPFVVVIVIPAWLAWQNKTALRLGDEFLELLAQGAGIVVLGCGFWMFLTSVRRSAGSAPRAGEPSRPGIPRGNWW